MDSKKETQEGGDPKIKFKKAVPNSLIIEKRTN